MNLRVVTPYTGPDILSLQEARQHLKVFATQDDDYIQDLIPVARNLAEVETGRRFFTTTLEMQLPQWPWNYEWCVLYWTPVTRVLSANYSDPSNGFEYHSYNIAQDRTSELFVQLGTPGRIARNAGWWSLTNIYNPVACKVQYQVGFANGPDDVLPEYAEHYRIAKTLTKWILHELYDNRSPISDVKTFEVSGPIERLVCWLSDGHYAPSN